VKILIKIAELTPATGFFLLIFLISTNSVLLKKRGVKITVPENRKSGKIKWIYPFFAISLLLFFSEIFKPVFGFSFLPSVATNLLIENPFNRIAGTIAVFLSVYLMRTTLQHFGTSLRFGMNENNTEKLVTNGVFARSRNPFFLSLLLYFCGTALVFPNLFFLIFAISAFAGIHFSILKEEKFLKQVYGDEYFEYCRKVRRYF
jgi:protein-S-isoprenylcysteine O-methyltransferase Ste14